MELVNRYQQANLQHRAALDKKHFIGEFLRRCGFVCVSCGREVSPLIVRFFHLNIQIVQCYTCQERNAPIPSESELCIVDRQRAENFRQSNV